MAFVGIHLFTRAPLKAKAFKVSRVDRLFHLVVGPKERDMSDSSSTMAVPRAHFGRTRELLGISLSPAIGLACGVLAVDKFRQQLHDGFRQ